MKNKKHDVMSVTRKKSILGLNMCKLFDHLPTSISSTAKWEKWGDLLHKLIEKSKWRNPR